MSQQYGWIGVDVGTHTVKLAQTVRGEGSVRLHRASVIQRPVSWAGDDGLAMEQPITSYPEIRAALDCADFVGRDAVCALPMNVCELRSLTVPPGTEHERRTIISDELADEWAGRRHAMEFDYWETEPARGDKSSEGFNVSIMASSRLWISQLWRDCRRNGLNCWGVDGAPLALSRAVGLVGGLTGGRRALVVDWGCSNTTLCIAGDDRPLYSRRVHGCEFGLVLNAIVDAFDVTLDEAKYLVESEGLFAADGNRSGDFATAQAIASAAAPVLGELVHQIGRTRQFTEMQRRHLQPSEVWLIGGGASMKNIGPYLANELSLPVQIWSMTPASAEIPCAAGSRCAVFGGAAALSALAWRAA